MRLWLDMLFRPALGATRVVHTRLQGYGALVVLGALWASLMTLLALGGHAPSMTRGLPFRADQYYFVAAIYIGPLCVVLGDVFARLAQLISGASGQTCAALRITYGATVGTAFIGPDLIGYLLAGHDALGTLVRITAPITLVWLLTSSTIALRTVGVSAPRGVLAVVIAVVVQAVPAAFLIR